MVRRLPTPPPRRSSARSPSLTRPGSGPSTPTPAVTFHQEGEHVVQRMMWQLGFASVVFSRASLDYIGISMNSQESVWPAAAGGAYSTITSGSFDPSAEAMAGAQTNALLHNQTSIYVDAVRDNMDNMRVTSPPNLELALTEMNPMASVIPPKLPSPLVQSELLRLADAEVDMRPPPSPGSLLQSSYEEDLNFLREEREIYLHREATLRWLATLGDERDEGEEESEPKRSHWQQQCLESADYLEGSLESDVESELEAVLSDEPPEEEEAPTDESVCNNVVELLVRQTQQEREAAESNVSAVTRASGTNVLAGTSGTNVLAGTSGTNVLAGTSGTNDAASEPIVLPSPSGPEPFASAFIFDSDLTIRKRELLELTAEREKALRDLAAAQSRQLSHDQFSIVERLAEDERLRAAAMIPSRPPRDPTVGSEWSRAHDGVRLLVLQRLREMMLLQPSKQPQAPVIGVLSHLLQQQWAPFGDVAQLLQQ